MVQVQPQHDLGDPDPRSRQRAPLSGRVKGSKLGSYSTATLDFDIFGDISEASVTEYRLPSDVTEIRRYQREVFAAELLTKSLFVSRGMDIKGRAQWRLQRKKPQLGGNRVGEERRKLGLGAHSQNARADRAD